MAKTVVKMLVFVVQSACASFLKLDGWSAYVNERMDSGLYDMALDHVYRSMMGKGRPNPWFQLGLLIIGGAIVYQLDNMAKETASNPNGSSNGILKFLGMASNLVSMFGGGSGGGATKVGDSGGGAFPYPAPAGPSGDPSSTQAHAPGGPSVQGAQGHLDTPPVQASQQGRAPSFVTTNSAGGPPRPPGTGRRIRRLNEDA